jgi:peptidoglycan-N-acetylglucosamine deacetylase
MKGLFLSVDVDSLYLYLGLYGKDARDHNQRIDLVRKTYETGVLRFANLFAELGAKGTFFVVGQDLDFEQSSHILKDVVNEGHCAGNHTWSHPYEFIRLTGDKARAEILGGHGAIEAATGTAPTIFRAPGYNMTDREYIMLEEAGYSYDASPLPSYPYLALKYSVLSFLALTGKKSRSIWGNPMGFLGPREPYQRGSMTVLPNGATSWLRLPVIGTALSTAPSPLFNYMLWNMKQLEFVSLEFHAVDLMGLVEDSLPQGLASQKDLAIPVQRKRERFKRFIGSLLETHPVFLPTVHEP